MILTKRHFETINNYDFTWTDIQKPTRENISTLGSQYSFHELNLDDCLSKIHIPKIDKYKDHLFIILNFPVNKISISIIYTTNNNKSRIIRNLCGILYKSW